MAKFSHAGMFSKRVLMLILLLLLVGGMTSGAQSIVPVTRPDTNSLTATGSSLSPSFSGDSRHLVFESSANNLVTNDDDGPFMDVFLLEIESSATELISVTTNGWGGGNGHSAMATVSSNGQFVAFLSEADNLAPNDTNKQWDLFLRDRAAGQTRLVSVAAGGQGSALGGDAHSNHRLSDEPLLSADARWVVFASRATNLVDFPDLNGESDVFARDLEANVTWLVSANAAGNGTGNGAAHSPSLSRDKYLVAFVSEADDAAAGISGRQGEIFVKDLTSGSLTWVSASIEHVGEDWAGFYDPVLSADGSKLAFKGGRTNDVMARGYIVDLATGSNWLTQPALIKADGVMHFNGDGRYLVFEDANYVHLWDLAGGGPPLRLDYFECTEAPGGAIPQRKSSYTRSPSISADGETIAFVEMPTCSDSGDTGHAHFWNHFSDFGRAFARIERSSSNPIVSPDGAYVAYATGSPLVAYGIQSDSHDENDFPDVVLHKVAALSTTNISVAHPGLEERLTAGLPRIAPHSLSADGQTLVFSAEAFSHGFVDTNGVRDLFVFNAGSGQIHPLNAEEMRGDWWPDHFDETNYFFLSLQEPALSSLSADGRFVIYTRAQSLGQVCDVCSQDYQSIREDLRDGTRRQFASYVHGKLNRDGMLATYQAREVYLNDSWRPFTHTNIVLINYRLPFRPPPNDYYPGPHPQLISVARDPSSEADGDSVGFAFTPDDRWVLFLSRATNLLPEPLAGGPWRLYARDLHFDRTRLVSRDEQGNPLGAFPEAVVISANARFVAFQTEVDGSIYRHDLWSEAANVLICHGCAQPSMTGDGSEIVYASLPEPGNLGQIQMKHVDSPEVRLLSINPATGDAGDADSHSPTISHDGRFVYFESRAGNLIENDHNGVSDVFVLDRWNDWLVPVSRARDGSGTGQGKSGNPVVSADGRTVGFESFAGDLTPGDFNGTRDLFLARMGGADGDEDGMEDDWELVFFDTLERAGDGDFDGDGATDLDEFKSGSNPMDDESRLAFLKMIQVKYYPEITLNFHLLWRSVPGRTYWVELRGKAGEGGWTDVSGPIHASGTVASFDFLDWRPSLRGEPWQAYFRVRMEE